MCNYIKTACLVILTSALLYGCQKSTTNSNFEINKEQLSDESVDLISFTPPPGWRFVDSKELSPSVKVMVVGDNLNNFSPSINISAEKYCGTLKEYLQLVNQINKNSGSDWKNLGMISTLSGDASYSQVDRKTEWGDLRMMHVIIQDNEMIYIMTAAARKSDFQNYYQVFFNAFKSLKIQHKDPDNQFLKEK